MEKLETKKKFEFRGEPIINVFMAISGAAIIVILGIGLIGLWKLDTILIGTFLISLMIFSLRNAITKVVFSENGILVKYLYGHEKDVKYNQCKKMYKSNSGELPASINVIKFNEKGKERTITFACKNHELHDLCAVYFEGFEPKFR